LRKLEATMLGKMMVSALALTGVAYAQETNPAPAEARAAPSCEPAPTCATPSPVSSADRVAYDAAFFAQFNPQNALDMVRQTPGFTLDGGEDRRGFSGAVGNLLIDGTRPTAKSQSLDSILSRIPANQVLRVELLRGAETSGDASGQSVLLNVVRTASAGSGVWRLGGEYNEGNGPRGEASYNGRAGQFEYGVGVDVYSQYRAQRGRREYYDALGALTQTARTPSPRDFREGSVTANAAMPVFDGRLSANAQYYRNRFHALNGFFFADPAGAPLSEDRDVLTEKENNFELGLNYDRDIGAWSLALVGLLNRGGYANQETITSFDPSGAFTSAFTQDVDNESSETIVRGALSRSLGRHRFEFGAEGAVNSLDASLALTSDDGTGPVVLVIPNSNVLVEEERAEAFAVHTWRPDDRWSVETRLAGEQSTLTFAGDTNQSVELAFFKPSVQVSRALGQRNQLRFRAYRDIDQLDFNDFVSAAGLTDNRIEGGNPDLRPQTSWRAELGADLRFPGNAALNTTLTRYWFEDLADLVTLIDTRGTPDPADDVRFDAPGNIGKGDAWSLETQLTLPLRRFIPGAQLTVEAEFWSTEVDDRLTGRTRAFNGFEESEVEVEFRQDLTSPRVAWGVSYYDPGQNVGYRFNEIDTYEEGPWVDVFVETTEIENMRVRLTAANVANGQIERSRLFFEAPDRAGPLTSTELRFREFSIAPWFILEVSGTF
jgi:hypothetical protein